MHKNKQKQLLTEIMNEDAKYGLYNYQLKWILKIKTRGGFLWRLWFLISAPIIWLIKDELNK